MNKGADPAAPKVSVIIITRNRPAMLADCLAHLACQTYRDFETIVVDSSDNCETRDLLERWPQVRYFSIWDGRNNMPTARNLGIRHAQGELVAFLDDDAMAFPEWLANIVSEFADEQVGGVGGIIIDERLLVPDDQRLGVVEPSGRTISNFARDFSEKQAVDWLMGASMAFRKSILQAIGGFDDRYVGDNSYEEVDVACRVRQAGFMLIWTPGVKVHHLRVPRVKGVVSRNSEAVRYRFFQAHNHAYFVAKNLPTKSAFHRFAGGHLYGLIAYSLKKRSPQTLSLVLPTAAGYVFGELDALLKSKLH